jgi:hypothetical protein
MARKTTEYSARRIASTRRQRLLAVVFGTAVLATLVPVPAIRSAFAAGCSAGQSALGGGGAGTDALFGEISRTISAAPLSVSLSMQSVGGTCISVYAVKVLTASGSVAVLSYNADNLDLIGVEGPADDAEVAKLFDRVQARVKAKVSQRDELLDTEQKLEAGTNDDPDGDDGENGDGGDGDGGDGDGGDGDGGDGDGGDGDGGDGDGGDGDGGDGGEGGEGGDGGGSGSGGSGGGGEGGGGEGGGD